jgi:hypothetical protein
MKKTAKIYIGIVFFVIAAILGITAFGSMVANRYNSYFSLAPAIGIISLILFIPSIWLIVSSVKIKVEE